MPHGSSAGCAGGGDRLPPRRRHAPQRAGRGGRASLTSPATCSPASSPGPTCSALIDQHTVEELTSINTLALALIAFEGGAELKLAALRRGVEEPRLGDALPEPAHPPGDGRASSSRRARSCPSSASSARRALVGAGLLWGALAITRSPSATLGILSQTRASGPLARVHAHLRDDLGRRRGGAGRRHRGGGAPADRSRGELLGPRAHHPRPRPLRQRRPGHHARPHARGLPAARGQAAQPGLRGARLRRHRGARLPALRRAAHLHGRGLRRAEPLPPGREAEAAPSARWAAWSTSSSSPPPGPTSTCPC